MATSRSQHVAVCSSSSNQDNFRSGVRDVCDVFHVHPDGKLARLRRHADGMWKVMSLHADNTIVGGTAATSIASDFVDLFGLDKDGRVVHRAWTHRLRTQGSFAKASTLTWLRSMRTHSMIAPSGATPLGLPTSGKTDLTASRAVLHPTVS